MKSLLSLAAAFALAASTLTVPHFAVAQAYRSYGSYDPCLAEKRAAGNRGTVTGGILGAVIGSAVAGRGNRFAGAVVGGGVGAVAGHAVGRSSVHCIAYPARYRPRRNCHWMQEYENGHAHQFEVCRDADGVWRPSGRR